MQRRNKPEVLAPAGNLRGLKTAVDYGADAVYCGGKVDQIMMRIVDIIYSLPDTLMVILLSVVLNQVLGNALKGTILAQVGTNMLSLFVVFGLLYWVSMARLVRGQILSLREQEYMTAAEACGLSVSRRIFTHPWRQARPHHPQAYFTQLHQRHLHIRCITDPVGHLYRELPELHRSGRAGAHALAGLPGQRGARRHAELSVEDALPGAEHLPDRAELQPAGRRPARRLRPQAEEVMNE